MNTINQKHQLLKIRLETTKALIPFKGVINSKREIKAEKKLLIKELYKRVRNLEKELEIIETKIKLMKDINRINELIKHTNFVDNRRELIEHFFINKQNKIIKKFMLYHITFFNSNSIFLTMTKNNKYKELTPFSFWIKTNNDGSTIEDSYNNNFYSVINDNIFFIGKSIKERNRRYKIHSEELVYNLELNNIVCRKSWSRKKLIEKIMKM